MRKRWRAPSFQNKEGLYWNLPAFISNKVERNGDNCILTLTTKQAKIAAIVSSIIIIAALVLGIWGIVRQAEVVQLRQQTQLQSEQLKLLQQKTDVLDKKIQNLNQISEENKQMLKGVLNLAHHLKVAGTVATQSSQPLMKAK